MAKKYFSQIFLFAFIVSISCGDSNDESPPITELYPLDREIQWTYEYIDDFEEDTITLFADYSLASLSDDESAAVIELYDIEFSVNVGLRVKNGSLCIDFVEGASNQEPANPNELDFDCGFLLKLESGKSDWNYNYSYSTDTRNYSYQVEVTEEQIELEFGMVNVFKFVIPAGSRPDLYISEVYFNEELGIVKIYPEYEIGAIPDRKLILVNTLIPER